MFSKTKLYIHYYFKVIQTNNLMKAYNYIKGVKGLRVKSYDLGTGLLHFRAMLHNHFMKSAVFETKLFNCVVQVSTFRLQVHTLSVRVNNFEFKMHTFELKVNTFRLKVHTLMVRVNNFGSKLFTLELKVNTLRLKVHTCTTQVRTCMSQKNYFGVRLCTPVS